MTSKRLAPEELERMLLPALLLAATNLNDRLFRNQVGTYQLADGRYLSTGLCPGSSDLIGFHQYVIGPDDVGKPVAVFASIEAKSKVGRLSKGQAGWIEMVNANGGIGAMVRSTGEFTDLLTRWRPGMSA